MTKTIAVDRKYFKMVLSILFVGLISLGIFSFWSNNKASVIGNNIIPEIKMLGLAVEPTSITKDLTYGSTTLKGMQVIPAKTFDLIATVQNTTAQKMTNIPVELHVSIVGDDKQEISTLGNLPTLEPGASARVAFRQVKALGDALGKSPTAGQHLIVLRIKPNPAGGVNQTTEASFRFNVDSTVKEPLKK